MQPDMTSQAHSALKKYLSIPIIHVWHSEKLTDYLGLRFSLGLMLTKSQLSTCPYAFCKDFGGAGFPCL